MRQRFLELIEEIGDKFNKLQKSVEEWFKDKFEKLGSLKDSYPEKSSYTYEHQYTNFGKEREYLKDLHKGIFKKEKHDTENLRLLIQNMLNDYDELIRKYRGIVPLDFSIDIIPDKAHAEEGREIEKEILQFFPSNCKREDITKHVTEMIKHVQETSFPDTPIWVKVTQHKEK
ncbi:MAG: hypothetical protein ACE5KZ_12080 [Candidatus Scalinduaceae bacterium]